VRRGTPAGWIAEYRAALSPGEAGAALYHAGGLHLAKLVQLPAAAAVLCHSDLHRLNLLIGDRPVLLDWEYAHVSDGLWDLAGWAANNDWSEAEAGLLLAAYAGRPPGAADRERLATWVWLYDYVCLLWSELYLRRRPGPQAGAVAARAQVLAQRLLQSARRWS
jgi:thiamine kinase-like enzyme